MVFHIGTQLLVKNLPISTAQAQHAMLLLQREVRSHSLNKEASRSMQSPAAQVVPGVFFCECSWASSLFGQSSSSPSLCRPLMPAPQTAMPTRWRGSSCPHAASWTSWPSLLRDTQAGKRHSLFLEFFILIDLTEIDRFLKTGEMAQKDFF